MTSPSSNLASLRGFLHDHLLQQVLPFWERHAMDPAGGINTCLSDDGTVQSRDKWLWSQWRAVWVFSRAFNCLGRNPRWLEIAHQIAQFASRFGWDDSEGGWRLCVSGEGRPLRGCESIYTDAFAIAGLMELAKGSGQENLTSLAGRTADSVLRRLRQPHEQIPHFPYPIPTGARVHGIPMIFSLTLWELGHWLNEPRYCEAAVTLSDEIFQRFYRPDRDLLLERVAIHGGELPAPLGTVVVPGHVIEDMWFQIHIARERADTPRIQQACRMLRRHMELGWDAKYGGLFLAVDADNRNDIAWAFADTKLWWPHTEALYALLLAYEQTREPWCLEWYDRVHEYSFRHYPVADHGEWRQRLDRLGQPFAQTVALPVKDPFHLPRALMYCVAVLDRLTAANPGGPSQTGSPASDSGLIARSLR